MNEELSEKLDELIELINKDEKILEMKKLKEELINNKDFMKKLNSIKEQSYITPDIKKELYENDNYRKYQILENELYFLTLEINKRLNKLTDKSRCKNENN